MAEISVRKPTKCPLREEIRMTTTSVTTVTGSRAVGSVLLRPEEAARALAIGRTAVFELIRSGRLRSVKVGGLRRIPVTALDEFVRQLEEEQL